MTYRTKLGKPFPLSPASVRFSQDSVRQCFQNEDPINHALEEIVEGKLTVKQFPYIRVLLINGEYYSVDNRRLYVFRVLNILGKLPFVDVRQANQFDREFTTENNGCHVQLRNLKDNNGIWISVETFRHCSCAVGRNSNLPSWWDENRQCHKSQINIVKLPSPTLNVSRFPTITYVMERNPSNQTVTKGLALQTNIPHSRQEDFSKHLKIQYVTSVSQSYCPDRNSTSRESFRQTILSENRSGYAISAVNDVASTPGFENVLESENFVIVGYQSINQPESASSAVGTTASLPDVENGLSSENFEQSASGVSSSSPQEFASNAEQMQLSPHFEDTDLFNFELRTSSRNSHLGSRDISTNLDPTKVTPEKAQEENTSVCILPADPYTKQLSLPVVTNQPKNPWAHGLKVHSEITMPSTSSNNTIPKEQSTSDDSKHSWFTTFLCRVCSCCVHNDK